MFHEIEPQKLNIAYVGDCIPEDLDLVICVRDGKVMRKDSGDIVLPTVGELGLSGNDLRFLFKIDEVSFYMPTVAAPNKECYIYDTPRDLRYLKPMWISYAATLGFRIQEFYRTNAFCGCCGGMNVPADTERAMICTKCGYRVYPAIAPSVIVLIRNGEKIVLTKYQASHSSYRKYALVAGYVESGETPEEAVEREVYEEVGLKVKNISYYKSQPWPVSGALLLGYVCDLDGDDFITRQEDELAVAEWVERKNIPNRSEDVSLSSEMMEMFRIGHL